MMHLILLVATLQGVPPAPASGDTLEGRFSLRPDSADMATAYADPGTRELVQRARGQRDLFDASVFRYRTTARQRISVGIRALRRDRLIYRRESASEIDWRRDGRSTVTVRGDREVIPVAVAGVRVPDDVESFARGFVPLPGDDRLLVSPVEGGFAWHPLVEGGEAVYQYATGDTSILRLPDGREVRLVELRVTPRERDIRLVTGSFWIEQDDHAIVKAIFRPAREFDLERDLPEIAPEDADDAEEIPGILKPIRFEARYITVEYAFWEMRWWMPRLMAFEGHVQAGPARFPVSLELSYSDYRIEASPLGLPDLPPVTRQLAGDPSARLDTLESPIDVVIPDSASLLTSELLPPSIYEQGEALISEEELEELGDRLGDLPPLPWEIERPRLIRPWTPGSGLIRYNRVEGVSLGARVEWDLTRAQVDATGRYATGGGDLYGELGVEVTTLNRVWRGSGYSRLAAANPAARPFGLGNSINSLLFGHDAGQYFRATGAELVVSPAAGGNGYGLRAYAERQADISLSTEYSLSQTLGGDGMGRPNIRAAQADQVGLAGWWAVDRGLDPSGFRWGARLDIAAEAGSYQFVRPGLTLRAASPLPGDLIGGIEVGGGTTLGASGRGPVEGGGGVPLPAEAQDAVAPVQSHWFLGGPATLRGFDGGSVHGESYLRTRLEIATDLPAARLAIFSDAGWAGPDFADYHADAAHVSVGIGGSFLDGLLRLDLARTVQPFAQWRVELYLDALL